MDEQYSIFPERHFRYAGFGDRLLAALIDGVLLSVANLILDWILPLPDLLINIITNWLYYALMESGAGQATIGKRVMGIMVVSTNGNRISFLNATGRFFSKFISTIILLIGYLMVLWDDRKQALHDKMANTFVIKA